MKITIVTLFPGMAQGFFAESIIKRAVEKGIVEIEYVNLKNFSLNSYGSLDDKPYGGGVGMVMQVEPVHKALLSVTQGLATDKRKILLTSPRGIKFSQPKAQEYATLDHMVIVCGHYEGIDERIAKYIDEEVSLGDFVMTGGEITAAAITDAVVRLIPGVLKHEEATANESFFTIDIQKLIKSVGSNDLLQDLKSKGITTVTLLEYPQYTRPVEYDGQVVPQALLSGHHEEVEKWRIQQAYKVTLERRPDLLKL